MNSLEIGMLTVVLMGLVFIAIVKYEDYEKNHRTH
jgi:hypothetical protein